MALFRELLSSKLKDKPSNKWERLFDRQKYMSDYNPLFSDKTISWANCMKVDLFVKALSDKVQSLKPPPTS